MHLAGRPAQQHRHPIPQLYLYEQLGLDFIYKAFSTTDIVAAIGGVRALGIRGCSVSMPFKEAVLDLVDDVERSALAIGSVNTIVNDAGVLTASNTDYIAVQRLIADHRLDPNRSVLIHGSGGMAKRSVRPSVTTGFTTVSSSPGTRPRVRSWPSGSATTGVPRRRGHGVDPGERDADRNGWWPRGIRQPVRRRAVAQADTVFDVVALPAETPLIAAAPRRQTGDHRRRGDRAAGRRTVRTLHRVRPTPAQVDEASTFSRSDSPAPQRLCGIRA